MSRSVKPDYETPRNRENTRKFAVKIVDVTSAYPRIKIRKCCRLCGIWDIYLPDGSPHSEAGTWATAIDVANRVGKRYFSGRYGKKL